MCFGQLQHLLLDFGEVFAADAAAFAQVDVVVEAVFDGRADGQLHAGVQRFERLGHEVGRGVPVGGFAGVVVPGQDVDGGVVGQGAVQVAHFAVDADGEGVAGEAFGDAGGEVVARGAVGAAGERSRRGG